MGNTNLAKALQAEDIKDKRNTQKYLRQALKYYQQAATITKSVTTKIQAQLNQLSLMDDPKQSIYQQDLLSSIFKNLNQLPASRTSIYARVNFAVNLIKLKSRNKARENYLNVSQKQKQ